MCLQRLEHLSRLGCVLNLTKFRTTVLGEPRHAWCRFECNLELRTGQEIQFVVDFLNRRNSFLRVRCVHRCGELILGTDHHLWNKMYDSFQTENPAQIQSKDRSISDTARRGSDS